MAHVSRSVRGQYKTERERGVPHFSHPLREVGLVGDIASLKVGRSPRSSFRSYALGEVGDVRITDCGVKEMKIRPSAG